MSGNVAERNVIGFENANASDSVVITGNRFTNNRVGLTLISNYQEAFRPQQSNDVIGNVISNNNEAQSPMQADGGFGIGVGIDGGQQNRLRANHIAENVTVGLILRAGEDMPAANNTVTGNRLTGNGIDIAEMPDQQAPAADSCYSANELVSTSPAGLQSKNCPMKTSPSIGAFQEIPRPEIPRGMSFVDVPAGPAQPQMAGDLNVIPEPLPGTVTMPDLTGIQLPDANLLGDRAGA